jgi:KDO2-lipid IV(A) lauroyltransferase
LYYAFSPQFRRILRHNLAHVLGPEASEEQLEATVHRACVNIMKGHYDLFRLSRLSLDEIVAITRVEGREHMDAALAQGKGAILISAHFGNVDIMAQIPPAFGIPISGAVEHIQPERLFKYILGLRTRHGVRMIPSDGPMMELYRALKRGELIGLPCDRSIADSTREVEFFGAPAQLPAGPVRLALRTGAPLIPGFGQRLADDTFLARIEPALDLPRTGDREADIAAGMEMIADVLERTISQAPDQWLVAASVWPMNSS